MSLRERLQGLEKENSHHNVGLPVGLASFDRRLGGLPRGGFSEISDSGGIGKTSFALQAAAHVTRSGGLVAWLALEPVLSTDVLARRGIDLSHLILITPSGADSIAALSQLLSSRVIDLAVIDSVAALADDSGSMAEPHRHAAYWQEMMRPLQIAAQSGNTAVLLLNQERKPLGHTARPTGGPLLHRWMDLRLRLSATGTLHEDGRQVGTRVTFAASRKEEPLDVFHWEMRLLFQAGFCPFCDLLAEGLRTGIVTRRGSWFVHEDVILGQGIVSACRQIKTQPDTCKRLQEAIAAASPTWVNS